LRAGLEDHLTLSGLNRPGLNRLVHGRVLPEIYVERSGLSLPPKQTSEFPRIEKVDNYLDWRRAQDPALSASS